MNGLGQFDGLVMRSNLSPNRRRYIREMERHLDRKCRSLWTFTNPLGERFVFGSFCRNYDRLIVTVSVYAPGVGWIWAP